MPEDPALAFIGAAAIAGIGIGAAILLSQQQAPPPPPPPGEIATGLSIALAPNPAPVNQPVAISGKLIRADTNAGIPSQSILLEQSTDQLIWQLITTASTGADGTYSAQVMFTAAGTYYIRARFAGA